MFSQVDLKTIATVFNKTVDEVSGAASSEDEKSLGLRIEGEVITEEKKKELKETSVQQGKEIASKELAKGLGITLDAGEKDPVIIAEKLKTTLTKELEEKFKNPDPSKELIEASRKIADLEDANEKLSETLGLKEKELGEWNEKHTTLIKENQEKERNNKILKYFSPKLSIDREDALLIVKNKLKIEEDENGREIIRRDGKTILNTAGQPETLENAIKIIEEEKGWISQGGGMGGGDRNGSGQRSTKGGKTADEAYKLIKEAGVAPSSSEGLKLFKEYTAPVEA